MKAKIKHSNTTLVKVKSKQTSMQYVKYLYSNTTLVKVKSTAIHNTIGAVGIQIQLLLKLNQILGCR